MLPYVNASDGQWHMVCVERIGRWASLQIDTGEGRYFNETLSTAVDSHLEIHIARSGFLAGGDVRFPSATAAPLVNHDFENGKKNELARCFAVVSTFQPFNFASKCHLENKREHKCR